VALRLAVGATPEAVFTAAVLVPIAVPVRVIESPPTLLPTAAVIAPPAVSVTPPAPPVTAPPTLIPLPVPPAVSVTPAPVTDATVIELVAATCTGPLAALAVRATLPVCCR
jgi:hypothetical protein